MTADLSGRALGARDGRREATCSPRTRRRRAFASSSAASTPSQQEAFRALLLVLALAAASVIAVMVVQFQSFVEPLVVLLAAPLSFVGAIGAAARSPARRSTCRRFMGLILLVGLIVKNGIILLDFTHHRMRDGGVPLERALREAARIRLRPILMTTLCTLFGLLPLALGLGAGASCSGRSRWP